MKFSVAKNELKQQTVLSDSRLNFKTSPGSSPSRIQRHRSVKRLKTKKGRKKDRKKGKIDCAQMRGVIGWETLVSATYV